MQTIQIDGTFTYADNIKTLKLGDNIKLISNPNNRINSEAIGAYTLCGKKIGYVPYKLSQINIKGKYYVSKINLSQQCQQLLISYIFDNSNFIIVEPIFIKENKYKHAIIESDHIKDIQHFTRYLEREGHIINNIGITYNDNNFINIKIEISDNVCIFNTVSRKYYEENIFKYDEFYKYNLIPHCIYKPFQIHRLEIYLEKNYKSITQLLKMKKIKLQKIYLENQSILASNILNLPNCSFEKTESQDLIINNKQKLLDLKLINIQLENLLKLIIQYQISKYEYLNPHNYIKTNLVYDDFLIDLNPFFNDLKVGNICYNHCIKSYCDIDLYNENNIIEISLAPEINKEKLFSLILKLVITNKQIINLYNPIEGCIYKLEIPESIKNHILENITCTK
jgi:hypothetical protein